MANVRMAYGRVYVRVGNEHAGWMRVYCNEREWLISTSDDRVLENGEVGVVILCWIGLHGHFSYVVQPPTVFPASAESNNRDTLAGSSGER